MWVPSVFGCLVFWVASVCGWIEFWVASVCQSLIVVNLKIFVVTLRTCYMQGYNQADHWTLHCLIESIRTGIIIASRPILSTNHFVFNPLIYQHTCPPSKQSNLHSKPKIFYGTPPPTTRQSCQGGCLSKRLRQESTPLTVSAQLQPQGSIFQNGFLGEVLFKFWENFFDFFNFLVMKNVLDWGCISFSKGRSSIQEWGWIQ